MLVLTRKTGEAIHIDNEIVVTVLDIKGGRVRIGIDAPQRYRIVRQEIDKSPRSVQAAPQHPSLDRSRTKVGRSLVRQPVNPC